jgi:hypothetical protein
LREPQDRGLVEQRVEDPSRTERLLEAGGDVIGAALLGHVFAEENDLGILRQEIVERLIDRRSERPWSRFLREVPLGSEGAQAALGPIRTRRLGAHPVR